MAKALQKLELTWIGKGNEPKLEPRILMEDPSKSYGDAHSQNMLIHGDNLLALKALEQEYAGKIKCIFIDPPYNTGSAFAHYDDGVEHSLWLSLMRDRLVILKSLLSKEGSIWITIDDNESHYLKVLCDEVFGRKNFVANVVWQKKYAPANDAKWLSDSHDHILVYAKMKETWRPNKLMRTEEQNSLYKNPDGDERGLWMSDNYTCAKSADERPNLYYPVTNPNTHEKIWPKRTRVWAFDKVTHQRHVEEKLLYWGVNGNNSTPRLKKFLKSLRNDGRVSETVWLYNEVGHTQDARREMIALNSIDPFSTAKPEKLLYKIIQLSSNSGDIILDSFLGSGTTAAVAHKMDRKWIGIELGEHAHTHCLPRMQKVIKGEDKGGITEEVNWKGGGGFKFYTLAPSLIQKDKYGREIINTSYYPNMLAAAMAKQEGFRYSPDETNYWKQGFSSEKDFIFTTTQFITIQMLDRLSEELQPNESLLVCCKSFAKGCTHRHSNITIKKIPQMLLGRCEFGKDDYSFNIVNLPHEADENTEADTLKQPTEIKILKPKRKNTDDGQPNLFS